MSLDDIPLRPLERSYLSVMRWRAAGRSVLLLAIAIAADIGHYPRTGLPGVITALTLAWSAWSITVAARNRWNRRGFAFTGRELHVTYGWLTRVHTIMPVRRVQHIDLAQGLLERRYQLATLVLHTAGTEHSRVALPGLTRDEVEGIRDDIRASIEASPR